MDFEYTERNIAPSSERASISASTGLPLMAGGCASLAIAPDTPTHWLMPRVVIGFGLLFAGAGLVLGLLFDRLLRDG